MEKNELSDQILDYLMLLVGTDTTNPPGNEEKLVNKIIQRCQPDRYEIVHHNENRASLVVTIPGLRKDYTLGFAGHLDTVPIGNIDLYEKNPFGEAEGTLFFGRGSTDMCGGLSAMLLLMDHFKKDTPPVSLKFFFTADEEMNGLGAKELVEKKYFDTLDSLVICEPSNRQFGVCEKGTIWLKIIVKGTSCHASMPEKGKNALMIGFELLQSIKQQVIGLTNPHPLLGSLTCEATTANSGVKINMIPGSAEFEIDIRTLPTLKDGNAEILKLIQKICDEYEKQKGIQVTIINEGMREPLETDLNSEFYRCVHKSVKNDKKENIGIQFFTDGSIIIPNTKIPFLIYGPGAPSQCHTIDEHIDMAEIAECYAEYLKIIQGIGQCVS